MRRPAHFASDLPSRSAKERYVAAAMGVGLVHLAVIYGLWSGLAARITQSLPNIIDVRILEPAPAQVDLPPPSLPELVQPQIVLVPPPEIRISAPAQTKAITVEQKMPGAADTTKTPAHNAMPTPEAIHIPAPIPARTIVGTHTTPPYPPLSRRLGEEGIVQLKIAIGADGRVMQTEIAKSSGSERLDDAASEWVGKHWRYHPAMRDGKPVASDMRVNVVFNLKVTR